MRVRRQGPVNPGKLFPTLHRCAEVGGMQVRGGQLPLPDIPRLWLGMKLGVLGGVHEDTFGGNPRA
jgi:hypothetical protein